MTYRIEGLDPEPFEHMFGLPDAELCRHNAQRVVADSKSAFPCRVTLEHARPGESLLLVNYVSQNAATPYRTTHAIYVREGAREAPVYIDELPPVFAGRTLSLRGFDEEGMMADALISESGKADVGIRKLFDNPNVVTIHAHNAARGCFAAKIERT